MPYELKWERRGVVKRFFGHVIDDDLLRSREDIEGNYLFDGLRYIINDFLNCTDSSITHRAIEVISAIDKAASTTNPNIRVAFIATAPKLIATAIAYTNLPMTPYQTRIFSTVADARAWLAIPS